MHQSRRKWLDSLSEEQRKSLVVALAKYTADDASYQICANCGHMRWKHGASEYAYRQLLQDGPCTEPCRYEDANVWRQGGETIQPCDCTEYEPVLPVTAAVLVRRTIKNACRRVLTGMAYLVAMFPLAFYYLLRILSDSGCCRKSGKYFKEKSGTMPGNQVA